ncbi:hypothetical protein T459_09562, partial [Capsicum annuum]
DKVKDVIAEKVQEIEEDTDIDPIINVVFVQNGLPLSATIFNMVTNSTTSYETSPASLMDDNRLVASIYRKLWLVAEMVVQKPFLPLKLLEAMLHQELAIVMIVAP